jgi:predicted DNA-binding antitoxin AbrB/MazE fold protein
MKHLSKGIYNKASLLFLLLIFMFKFSSAQDKIKTKEGTNLNVKIIYVDKDYIYFYQQTTDPQKKVRKISKKIVSEFQYLSIEDGKNLQVIKEDSLLFVSYLNSQNGEPFRGRINYSGLEKSKDTTNSNSSVKLNNNQPLQKVDLKLPYVNQKFRNAGKHMLIANGLMLSAGILSYSALRVSFQNNASSNDIKRVEDLIKNLQTLSIVSTIASFGFSVSAGINIYNGSIYLK